MTQERYVEESAEELKGAPPAGEIPAEPASAPSADEGEEQQPPDEQHRDTHAEPRQPRPA